MKFILFFSNFMIPFAIFMIILSGMVKKLPVFDLFTSGTERGFQTVLKMAPVLIGLMSAVSALRASGILHLLEKGFFPLEKLLFFPARLIPLIVVRLFSTSAATGFLLDIFSEYGPDSFAGFTGSVIMSCTEAAFYTMSIYFAFVHIKKTRWTLPGAIFSTFMGIATSIFVSYLFLF